MPPDAIPYNAGNDDMMYAAMILATAKLQFWDTMGKPYRAQRCLAHQASGEILGTALFGCCSSMTSLRLLFAFAALTLMRLPDFESVTLLCILGEGFFPFLVACS